MLKWVEAETAPARIEASRVMAGKVARTRPLCAYPQTARYKGTGSIDEAANFTCVKPICSSPARGSSNQWREP